MTGPRNGAAAYNELAIPRWEAGNMSARIPPPFVRGEEPNAPAKNLVAARVAMF